MDHLDAYAAGELSGRGRRRVAAHLAECEDCRGRIEEIGRIEALFEETLPVPPVPDGLAARIMAEARRRQPTGIHERRSPLPAWNPLQWIAGLSVPMRLAACATVLLAFVAGLSLDGRNMTGRHALIEEGRNLSGLEWFAPVPPGSIAAVYLTVSDQPDEEEGGS